MTYRHIREQRSQRARFPRRVASAERRRNTTCPTITISNELGPNAKKLELGLSATMT
jgi:hypothetical protein